jgi:hypothetical protein
MIRAIVKDVITTSPLNHPSGKRRIVLTLQNRERGKFYANGTTPKGMIVEAGDQIEINPRPEDNYFGEEIRIIEKRIIRQIEIVATISDIRFRKDERFSQWLALSINAEGFVSAAGNVATDLRLERGMRCRFVGFPSVGPDGKPAFDFIYGGVTILESEKHDPVMLAARRVFPGFIASHMHGLRSELGDDWAGAIHKDHSLIKRGAFNRWKDSTKKGVIKAAGELATMPALRRDLLTVGVGNKTISKLIEERVRLPPDDNAGGDAMMLVRSRHLTFSQADDANKLNGFFRPTIERTLGAIWEGLRGAEEKGNSAVNKADMRDYLSTQYGFSEQEISEGLGLVGEEYSRVEIVSDGNNRTVFAFRENSRCERAIQRTIEDMKHGRPYYRAIQ